MALNIQITVTLLATRWRHRVGNRLAKVYGVTCQKAVILTIINAILHIYSRVSTQPFVVVDKAPRCVTDHFAAIFVDCLQQF
jgi:hypothetical protein